jgi:hypothetical protein
MKILALAALFVAAPALAFDGSGGAASDQFVGRPETKIPYAAQDGVRQFALIRGERSDILFLEGRDGAWYRAKFDAACPGADDATLMVFRTRGGSALDANGTVYVDRARCEIESLVSVNRTEALAMGLTEPARASTQVAALGPN